MIGSCRTSSSNLPNLSISAPVTRLNAAGVYSIATLPETSAGLGCESCLTVTQSIDDFELLGATFHQFLD
jgi:hypothetical protein